MREARNPFRLRASEQIESNAMFVRLFGPAMLSPLNLKQNEVDRFRIIRSAPGAGKTTLLRLFTPGPLMALCAAGKQDDVKELYGTLEEIGMIDESGPQLLGAMISCSRTFADIADVGLNEVQQRRVFLSLLDARLLLSALRSCLALFDGRYPDDLGKIEVSIPGEAEQSLGRTGMCTGIDLFNWAQHTEDKICRSLFSFEPLTDLSLAHDSLITPFLLRASNLRIEGHGGMKHILLLLDDAHHLATSQRRLLIELLMKLRAPAGIWLAERLEALDSGESLGSGATEGRDYTEPVLLEEHWRNGAKAFSKSLASIADRRVRKAADMEVSQFSECIEESLEPAIWHKTLDKAVDVIEIRVFKLSKQKPIFFNWIEQCRAKSFDPFERALNWRGLEILIARKLGKKQIEFDFDLDASEYNKQEDSSLRTAAEVFLSNEFGIPYYYGKDRLHTLASSNVEQFLMLAGDLFEESISQALIQNRSTLSTAQQHRIIMQASVRFWEEIPRRAGVDVHRFLHAIGSFSQWYTFRETAPNDPGVNGIAILMEDREKLMDLPYLARRPELQAVAGAIAKAVQFNLLDANHGYRCKGKDFMVLNLNRLLCAKFGLPLNRGQFKEQNLETLSRWLSSGYLKPTEPNDLW